MRNVLLGFAAGYFVAMLMNKSASVVPETGQNEATLVAVDYDDPMVKGIGNSYFPIHRGMKSKYLQL